MDVRFDHGIYTVRETCRLISVNPDTLRSWCSSLSDIKPRTMRLVMALDGSASISFAGLIESFVVRTIATRIDHRGRLEGSLHNAVEGLVRGIGGVYALCSRRVLTEGAYHISEAARSGGWDPHGLLDDRTEQPSFSPSVMEELGAIEYAADGYASGLRIPIYGSAEVVIDPKFSGGEPVCVHGKARVVDVLSLLSSGTPPAEVSEEYGVPADQVISMNQSPGGRYHRRRGTYH